MLVANHNNLEGPLEIKKIYNKCTIQIEWFSSLSARMFALEYVWIE